jgi:long-chain fatty acid transport protein
MDIDFEGNTTFYQLGTGAADLDAVLASRIPFNTKVPTRTTVQFPSLTMIGASYDIGKKLTVSVQADHWTWDVFDETVLEFDAVDNKQVPTSHLPHHWENVWTYRFGLRYKPSDSFYVGCGVLYDETPQPDEDTGPLLPDSNRTGYSIGLGFKMGEKTMVELSNLALFFHERTTTTNHDNFNGTYKTFADLIVLNLRHSF